MVVYLRPIRSENTPVGISNMALLTMATEKILNPKTYDPDTSEKYIAAIGAHKLKPTKNPCQVSILIFLVKSTGTLYFTFRGINSLPSPFFKEGLREI